MYCVLIAIQESSERNCNDYEHIVVPSPKYSQYYKISGNDDDDDEDDDDDYDDDDDDYEIISDCSITRGEHENYREEPPSETNKEYSRTVSMFAQRW